MELKNKLNSIIGQLKDINNLNDPNIEVLKRQVDEIENETLPKLDKDFDRWCEQIYDQGDPDEQAEQQMNYVDDLFIQAEGLVDSIREKFGIQEIYDEDDVDDQEDDDLYRTLLDDEDDDDCGEDEYDIVLKEVSKSALNSIGLDNQDERSVNLMGTILIGIFSGETDDDIAGRALAQILLSGFMLPMDKIKEMCKETREKCKKQLFGLQIAYSSLREYNCSAEDALMQIQMFL